MSCACGTQDAIFQMSNSSGLDNLVNEALRLIRQYLFANANFVNSPKAVSIILSNPTPHEHVISPSEFVFEIEKYDADRKLGFDCTGWRGFYNSDDAKMYLIKNSWCIETIIHEALHACSVTSQFPDLLRRHRALFEGLTEFYAGVILFKNYQDCYNNCWRTQNKTLCEMTYVDTTKIWAALCKFVPLSTTTGLYFFTPNTNIANELACFAKKIQSYGYNKFQSPFTSGGLPSHLKLMNECVKNFKNFADICNNRTMFSDFRDIKF